MIGWLLNALDGLPGWARRGMVIVFPLLLFGVIIAAFALAPSSGGRPAGRSTAADHLLPPSATGAPAPAVLVPPSSPSYATPPARTSGLGVVDPDRPMRGPSPLRRMLATARSFADAYVLYEIGRLPRPVHRAIVATCTPAFARYLLAQPARLAGLYAAHSRDVEVDRVVSVSFAGGVRVEVSYAAEQNRADTGAFLVKLTRTGGRWLVASVGL